MSQPENEKENQKAEMNALLEKQLLTSAKATMSTERLDKTAADLQSKLIQLEQIDGLQSEASQCRAYLDDVVKTNVRVRHIVNYMRGIYEDMQDNLKNNESDEDN